MSSISFFSLVLVSRPLLLIRSRLRGCSSLLQNNTSSNVHPNPCTWCQSTRTRSITNHAARNLLGLPTKPPTATKPPSITLKELRQAYFAAAKKCHPDTKSSSSSSSSSSDDNSAMDFLQVTRAYEVLQQEIAGHEANDLLISTITTTEEEKFRRACRSWLGIDAEIVEECKQNPIFRKWLSGRTDSASHWRMFFLQHGGLAPKLRPSGGQLSAGNSATSAHTRRRKRK